VAATSGKIGRSTDFLEALERMTTDFGGDLLPLDGMAGFLATVLICDDEPSLRELIRVSLDGPYAFAEANDGEESLEIARRLRPDVVILDMMMPRRNGLEVLGEIRRDAKLADLPVIVLTAQPATREEALREGANLVIVKPFEPDQISAAVEEVLAERA
jgi:CheY-like chemotaxis protein